MLQCPKQTFATLFYYTSNTFLLLFIFFHLTLLLLSKLFTFFGGNPFYQRNQDEYEFEAFSEDDETEEEEHERYVPEPIRSVADVILGDRVVHEPEESSSSEECLDRSSEETSYTTPPIESSNEDDEILEEDFPDEHVEAKVDNNIVSKPEAPVSVQKNRVADDEIFGDAYTIGSTSKDSSEWRRSSCTEDPFSSSSRRSCHKWESYTLFQKYDEEMLFLDRITFQKLHETESLRSIKAGPRSLSDRIVRKFRTRTSSENPYHELEAAYVAQICLTWEALNWNYKYFQRLRASRREFDPGCPAYVAQQFQQFQVLLQRFVENEPYEHGKRPEIYARTRGSAPKLLQVPEYRDSDNDKREEGSSSRIPSSSFNRIMQESMKTFMNFLKQDKKSKYRVLADLLIRRKPSRRGSVEENLLLLLKKENRKKRAKLNELRRSGSCLRRQRLKEEEELEILMAELDLKLVSRVLRTAGLNGEQLQWCENKMSKVRVSDGKLHRDSSPLFFPAH